MDVAETGFADMRQGFRMNILMRERIIPATYSLYK